MDRSADNGVKEAAEAQRTMSDRKQFGKIVLTP